MNEACLEKRDASCVLIQDARRDTRRMITRDEKCLISCVFRKEMVSVEERRKSFFPFDFRSVRGASLETGSIEVLLGPL